MESAFRCNVYLVYAICMKICAIFWCDVSTLMGAGHARSGPVHLIRAHKGTGKKSQKRPCLRHRRGCRSFVPVDPRPPWASAEDGSTKKTGTYMVTPWTCVNFGCKFKWGKGETTVWPRSAMSRFTWTTWISQEYLNQAGMKPSRLQISHLAPQSPW